MARGRDGGIVAPLIVLSLPLLDTALVILVRRSQGRPVSEGGRDHSSHRLVYRGFGERHAVALLLAFAATCAGIAVALVAIDNVVVTLVAAVSVGLGLVVLGRNLAAYEGDGAERPEGGLACGRCCRGCEPALKRSRRLLTGRRRRVREPRRPGPVAGRVGANCASPTPGSTSTKIDSNPPRRKYVSCQKDVPPRSRR